MSSIKNTQARPEQRSKFGSSGRWAKPNTDYSRFMWAHSSALACKRQASGLSVINPLNLDEWKHRYLQKEPRVCCQPLFSPPACFAAR